MISLMRLSACSLKTWGYGKAAGGGGRQNLPVKKQSQKVTEATKKWKFEVFFAPFVFFCSNMSNLSKTIVELPNPSLQFSPRMAGRERTRVTYALERTREAPREGRGTGYWIF
jgi:hypothetical protein